MPKQRRSEEGWVERQCSKCHEWWPATREFFYSSGHRRARKLHSWCKACVLEAKAERRKRKKLEVLHSHA